MRMCSLSVGAVTSSLSAISTPQTPSSTRSPSTCGGKCARGSFSHPRIWRRRSFARALKRLVIFICLLISQLTNQCQSADVPPELEHSAYCDMDTEELEFWFRVSDR